MYLDYDLRPPSQAQIQYAVAIARREGLEIPADVLKKKVAMASSLTSTPKVVPEAVSKRLPLRAARIATYVEKGGRFRLEIRLLQQKPLSMYKCEFQ